MNITFASLYPDVDPTDPAPLSAFERGAIALAVGVLVFGGASGQLIIAGIGLLALIAVLYLISHGTVRRIRNEARARFPHEDWFETQAEQQLHLHWSTAVAWVVITGLTAACLFLVPDAFSFTGATVCALVSMLIVWFLPGMSSHWRVHQDHVGEHEQEWSPAIETR